MVTAETVASRLHAAVTNIHGPHGITHGLILTASDAHNLNQLIVSLCQDEQACELCGTRLCETCRVGEPSALFGCPRTHCFDCANQCLECLDAMADSHDAEVDR